ncbi:MAG: hypothetical protein ABIF09_17910 [Gemmatimonadota bacterium]
MRTLTLALLLAVASAWGCASTKSSQGDTSGSARDRITLEELEGLPPGSAFDAVQALRRNWLRSRGSTITTSSGRTTPEIFVNGLPFGSSDSLHQVGIEAISEIRYISASDATTRYGTGYTAGIIEIILKGEPE